MMVSPALFVLKRWPKWACKKLRKIAKKPVGVIEKMRLLC